MAKMSNIKKSHDDALINWAIQGFKGFKKQDTGEFSLFILTKIIYFNNFHLLNSSKFLWRG